MHNMYWQYPTTSSPHWGYSVAAAIPSCKENFLSGTPVLPVTVSNGKYGMLGCDDFSEIFEDDSQVKRPMNSFLLWAKIMRKKFAKDYPNLHNAEISKLLGKVWNSMTTSEKRPFVEKAEKLRVLHMRDHPNYRYSPKKKKEKRAAQRMIPPEVAAAFHNAIFDLKSIKTTMHFQGGLPDDVTEENQENGQFTKHFVSERDTAYPRMKMYKQSLEDVSDFPTTPYFYDGAFGSLVRTAHNCDTRPQERIRPTLAVTARSDNRTNLFAGRGDTRNRHQLSDNGKTYRYGNEFRDSSPISKIVLPQEIIQDSLDQVTPSSPQENLAYGISSEENFYPTVEPMKEQTNINNFKLQDFDSLSSCDNDSVTGSSPESCYDDEVPPFLRVLLDKPIHLNEPKCQQFQEKEDEIIFHDLGEIISKELGMERKACLYS